MSDKLRRNILGRPGPWYVDSECISCGICAQEAPANFQLADDGSTAFVFKQPTGAEEIARSEAAMDSCPVQAIGKDG
jgi:ferredoxin